MGEPDLRTSTQRPIPLETRPDLVCERAEFQGNPAWLVKDPVALKYFRLLPEQFEILQLLDGRRSLEQIRDEFHRTFTAVRLTFSEIQQLAADLHRSGLVYSTRCGQADALLKQAREKWSRGLRQTLSNPLSIRLPGWDPEPLLRHVAPATSWVFHPAAAVLALGVVLAAWSVLLVNFHEFHQRLPTFQQFFGAHNLLALWAILGGAKLIHEFGHAVACRRYGGECHEIGVLFLVLSPCLYCDVSDSWMLKDKWRRIVIGAAGMYVEVVISALAVFGWWLTTPGIFNSFCLNLFFISTLTTVVFNANPLLRYDGYYMLADWLEIPNLRQKADRTLRDALARTCLGVTLPADPFAPTRGRLWFGLFALASTLYSWVILFGIVGFFWTFLKPYGLQNVGILMAAGSLALALGRFGHSTWQVFHMTQNQPRQPVRMLLSGAALAGLVAALCMIPIPWNIEAPLTIEPREAVKIYTAVPGRLHAVHVAPGDRVEQGALLAELADPQREAEFLKLLVEEQVQLEELKIQRALPDPAQEQVVLERLANLRQQLRDARQRLQRLQVAAPCAGVVVAPPEVAPRTDGAARTELPTWTGTPLDPENRGSYLESRTHLLSLAPLEQYEAVLLVDQADRNDVAAGQAVRVKLDHLPDQTYAGTIAAVSPQQQEYAPAPLSHKTGGALPTTTDATGRERLEGVAYEATVPLDERPALLRAGLRGRARLTIATRTTGQWLWRWLSQTIRFRW